MHRHADRIFDRAQRPAHIRTKLAPGHLHDGTMLVSMAPHLVSRLDPEVGAQRITNLLNAWSHEIQEVLGALGINSIESLRGNRERLRGLGLDEKTLDILGIKPAGR